VSHCWHSYSDGVVVMTFVQEERLKEMFFILLPASQARRLLEALDEELATDFETAVRTVCAHRPAGRLK
jgi:hypothetical protein